MYRIEKDRWVVIGGKPCSEKTKKKIGDKNRGKKHSAETRKLLSEINSGPNNRMYGKHHTQDVKVFISRTNKGRPISEERRKQISKQTRGSGNPNFGKHLPHSEETKNKISEAAKQMWQLEEHRKSMSEKHQRRKERILW